MNNNTCDNEPDISPQRSLFTIHGTMEEEEKLELEPLFRLLNEPCVYERNYPR